MLKINDERREWEREIERLKPILHCYGTSKFWTSDHVVRIMRRYRTTPGQTS